MDSSCEHEIKRCQHCHQDYCVKCGIVPKDGFQHTHRVNRDGAVKHGV